MTGLLNFLKKKQIISISVILSAITFGFISKLISHVYDPIFEYLFPKKKLEDYYIILPPDNKVQFGLLFLELIKVLLYLVITYHFLNTLLDSHGHLHQH
tara:strand:- start:550 stop:846 length:297 start_codon:yes stop_codon:yes gene_type:complete